MGLVIVKTLASSIDSGIKLTQALSADIPGSDGAVVDYDIEDIPSVIARLKISEASKTALWSNIIDDDGTKPGGSGGSQVGDNFRFKQIDADTLELQHYEGGNWVTWQTFN